MLLGLLSGLSFLLRRMSVFFTSERYPVLPSFGWRTACTCSKRNCTDGLVLAVQLGSRDPLDCTFFSGDCGTRRASRGEKVHLEAREELDFCYADCACCHLCHKLLVRVRERRRSPQSHHRSHCMCFASMDAFSWWPWTQRQLGHCHAVLSHLAKPKWQLQTWRRKFNSCGTSSVEYTVDAATSLKKVMLNPVTEEPVTRRLSSHCPKHIRWS